MFTLSRLQSTNAQKRAKIIDQRFFSPSGVMSNLTSSGTVSATTGPPPPAAGTTDRRGAGAAEETTAAAAMVGTLL